MATLKQALAAVQHFQEADKKGVRANSQEAVNREVVLRTKLAQIIAGDNPPLNPFNPDDLLKVAQLPPDTELSHLACTVLNDYIQLLEKEFSLKISQKNTDPFSIQTFADIRDEFIRLRGGNENSQAMTWTPEELTAFHRLCVRLGRDNGLSTSEVMSGFKKFEDLKLNEASIYLAERFLEVLQK